MLCTTAICKCNPIWGCLQCYWFSSHPVLMQLYVTSVKILCVGADISSPAKQHDFTLNMQLLVLGSHQVISGLFSGKFDRLALPLITTAVTFVHISGHDAAYLPSQGHRRARSLLAWARERCELDGFSPRSAFWSPAFCWFRARSAASSAHLNSRKV